MKEAGDISYNDWVRFNVNPIESWCDKFKKWIPDTKQDCSSWVSFEDHDAQMIKYGI